MSAQHSRRNADELLVWWRAMLELRAFEEAVAAAHRDERLPGLLHLAIGAEAVTVGVVSQLGPDDRVFSSHRPHAHFLASDGDARGVIAELAGRNTGICRGRGGSMHLMGTRAVLATGVVGGTLPIAVGAALVVPPGAVCVSFFGDGAAQTGVFHESLNLAALWKAPVLFVCENNGMAEFTTREEHTTVRHVADYGALHGMASVTVDGTDVGAVHAAAAELLQGARAGAGPAILECVFVRLRAHYEGDARRTAVSDEWDAVALAERELVRLGISQEALSAERARAFEDARLLVDETLLDPLPDPDEDAALVYARWP